MRKKAAPHNNRIHFVLFVCVLCTMWCFVWFLHEMVLLLHENLNYCTKRIWYLCKLQNKNFSMVCCTTLWWDGAGKGRGWKTAAIIYCWQQQHVRGRTAQLSDISSGATCVADLDSRALVLTKEASGNSRVAGGGDSSVVRAPDSWLKGRGFESLLERRENFPGSTFCADSYFGIRSTPVLPQ